MRNSRSLLGLVIALVTAAVVWWTQGDGVTPDVQPDVRPGDTSSVQAPDESPGTGGATEEDRGGATDPDSGLPVVREADLPPEAHETITLIDRGGPFPYEEDGTTFSNREGVLPDRAHGYY